MRMYIAVKDIEQAVREAEESGAMIAYPPTRQGNQGTFASVIKGDLEHGLWQRQTNAAGGQFPESSSDGCPAAARNLAASARPAEEAPAGY